MCDRWCNVTNTQSVKRINDQPGAGDPARGLELCVLQLTFLTFVEKKNNPDFNWEKSLSLVGKKTFSDGGGGLMAFPTTAFQSLTTTLLLNLLLLLLLLHLCRQQLHPGQRPGVQRLPHRLLLRWLLRAHGLLAGRGHAEELRLQVPLRPGEQREHHPQHRPGPRGAQGVQGRDHVLQEDRWELFCSFCSVVRKQTS